MLQLTSLQLTAYIYPILYIRFATQILALLYGKIALMKKYKLMLLCSYSAIISFYLISTYILMTLHDLSQCHKSFNCYFPLIFISSKFQWSVIKIFWNIKCFFFNRTLNQKFENWSKLIVHIRADILKFVKFRINDANSACNSVRIVLGLLNYLWALENHASYLKGEQKEENNEIWNSRCVLCSLTSP